MDTSVLLRAALVQAALVAALSVALAIALPGDFFENWGWLSGPAAWVACSTLTARMLGLPLGRTLLGAALAGLPSVIAVLAGLHWLGAALAVLVFALWCGRLAASGREPVWT